MAQLRAMVAEREAKVRQLELEIGQLSVQVSWVPPGGQLSVQVSRVSPRLARQCPVSTFYLLALRSALATLRHPGSTWTPCAQQPSSNSVYTLPS